MSNHLRKSYDHMFKIIIIGRVSVGKTCLMNRFCESEFNEFYQPTIGADYKIHSIFKHDRRIKLQIWDTTGQERFQSLTQSYFRNSHGVILMYDISNQQSFDELPQWLEMINENTPKKRRLMLIGHKADLEEQRAVPKEKGSTYAEMIGATFFECSSKDNKNIHDVFDVLVDQIFFSKKRNIVDPSSKNKLLDEDEKDEGCLTKC